MKMNRQRWYRVQHNLTFADVINRIKISPYSEENSIGFELVEISRHKIIARYIEQQYVSELVQRPFSDPEEIVTLRYTIFYLEIIDVNNGLSVIKILNPPISLKNFVKKIVEIFGVGFSISKMNLKIDKVYEAVLKEESVDRCVVKKLSVSSIPFSEKTTAKLQLKSSGNAYEELRSRFKNNQYKLDKMHLQARLNGETESLEISSSGLIVCSFGFEGVIEKYMISLMKFRFESATQLLHI